MAPNQQVNPVNPRNLEKFLGITPQASPTPPAPTRPRLQAVNQDFSDLNEQIRQVAHIIGLPEDWSSVQEEEARSNALAKLVGARAEWVLRWTLDKLKDEGETGPGARANLRSWQLLDLMIHKLPVSRSTPHLRDASFPSILERTLIENYERDIDTPAAHDTHMRDAADSSDTIIADPFPSRKRKRGTPESTSSKRCAIVSTDRRALFHAVFKVLESIHTRALSGDQANGAVQVELMKMVLRTESPQAARILKFWFMAVQKLWLNRETSSDLKTLDLSLVMDLWELRIVNGGDESTSSEDFNTECLVPTLLLTTLLKAIPSENMDVGSIKAIENATQVLDKLLTRHLFAPARAAFFASSANPGEAEDQEPTALSGSLQTLRAKLLQASQIEDAGEVVPIDLRSLYDSVPQLLDLAIRASPAKTPKSRLAERPWIETVFITLVESLGCSLKQAPEYPTTKLAGIALQGVLRTLHYHSVSIGSETLKTLFRYYSGIEATTSPAIKVNWSLVAAIIELDPLLFTIESKSKSASVEHHQNDLAEKVFQQITTSDLAEPGFANGSNIDASATQQEASQACIIAEIIVPLISAFARNRNLLGFLRRWDDQLLVINKSENRKILKDGRKSIWEDRILAASIEEVLEQSLTQGQIVKLVQEHADRVEGLNRALVANGTDDTNVRKLSGFKKAASSTALVPALLQSIHSDENLSATSSQLRSLLSSYTVWVQDERFSASTQAASYWLILCQLVIKLWPLDLHSSVKLQESLLHPLLEVASKHISIDSKNKKGRHIDAAPQAAATLFLFNVCDRLNTVPGSGKLIRTSLKKALKAISIKYFDLEEREHLLRLFCAQFVHLLGQSDSDDDEKALKDLLSKISTSDSQVRGDLGRSLSEDIFGQGTSHLQIAYVAALSSVLQQDEDDSLQEVALNALNTLRPSVLGREKREAILDRLTSLLTVSKEHSEVLLGVAIKLMEQPNASADISKSGDVLFGIADHIQDSGLASSIALAQLQDLARRTLEHLIPNREQAQSKAFFKTFSKKLQAVTKGTLPCTAARLSILRATILEQKDANILNAKQYAALLKQCLADGDDGAGTASLQDILDAFNEIPMVYLQDPAFFKECQSWLRSWIKENADLDSYLTISGQSPAELAEYVGRLHTTVARFKLFPNPTWFVNLTLKVVNEPLSDHLKRKAYKTITETLATLELREKLELVPILIDAHHSSDRAARVRVLSNMISTLSDKLSTDHDLKEKQLALLPQFCVVLAESPDDACFNALLDGIDTILNDKPNYVTQHGIECVLGGLAKLTSRNSPSLSSDHATETYARLCDTTRLILLVHRTRLGGRLHLLNPILQNLLLCLFTPTSSRSGALPAWLRASTSTSPSIRLSVQCASHYTRVLSTLCNPPQSSISKTQSHQLKKSKDLNDPIKIAREKTSHFLYPLLASFCRYQLSGRLDTELRKKLMPGIWDVLGTASLKKEGLDAMFAGLGKSERDVWRGVWGEWESVRGRRENFAGKEEV